MVTPTLSSSSQQTSGRLLRVLRGFLVLVAGLAIAAAAAFYFSVRASLPKIDGSITVPGLSAPVTVVRDAQGVPHIKAATLDDLFFAQGYVTAQDRLWQMDITRRYAAGDLAEVLGASMVAHDRQQRILGLRHLAEAAAPQLDPRDRAFLQAYARGVNAYIDSHSHSLPIEFRILGYSPRPWTLVDSFLIGGNMAQMLNLETLPDALAREEIAAKVGPELAADLYVNSSWRDHPPSANVGADLENGTPSKDEDDNDDNEDDFEPRRQVLSTPPFRLDFLGAPPSSLPLAKYGFGSDESQTPDLDRLVPGSNNWVVSGAHTDSGKPLLSNDMHLGHQVPNVWYEAHLTSGNFDVAGVTLPGLPYVIVGHNQRIAWGFTNLGPAVSDLYVESFNPQGQYRAPDGWHEAEHRREIIKVKHGADVTLNVVSTRHGPIITPMIKGETRQIALKWVIQDPQALQVPFYDVDQAQNWEQFRSAFSRFGAPGQNVVYADVDGHIGYQTTGMIPIRASGDGTVPVSGDDNSHEWTGYVPYDKLPSLYDPPSGIIATANGRITPEGYPYLISNEWGSPYRTERIYRVLSSERKFSPEDMLELQTDIYSDFDRFCAERFTYAIDHAQNPSPRAREAAELMRNWDGRITIDSPVPTIVKAAREHLMRLLLEPKLGPGNAGTTEIGNLTYGSYRWFMSKVWLEDVLLHQPARWLPQGFPSYDDLLAKAVDQAIQDAPKKLTNWRWGSVSKVDVEHPIFAHIPVLRHWAGPGIKPQSGNGSTVKQVGLHFGPSERMTVDFSNLDGSTLNIVMGESENIFSQNFMDQWKAWYEGTTFPLAFTPAAVDKAARHRLTLEPSGNR
jgi:penicillin G amidase